MKRSIDQGDNCLYCILGNKSDLKIEREITYQEGLEFLKSLLIDQLSVNDYINIKLQEITTKDTASIKTFFQDIHDILMIKHKHHLSFDPTQQ